MQDNVYTMYTCSGKKTQGDTRKHVKVMTGNESQKVCYHLGERT